MWMSKKVLILLLLEQPLRRKGLGPYRAYLTVLILLLLEQPLRRNNNKSTKETGKQS